MMINSMGKSPFEAFTLFGIIFLILGSAAGSAMKNPPDTETKSESRLRSSGIAAGRNFRVLYFAMFTALAAGFAVNANLKQLFDGVSIKIGVAAVSVFAVANALGRIAWGMIFDRVRASSIIQANLVCQAMLFFCSFHILRSEAGLLVFAFISGFNYGGVLVLYASATARIWGIRHVGQVYGLLFSANIPAAISPILSGYGYDYFGSFTFPLAGSALLLIVAAFIARKQRNIIDSETAV